MCVNIRSRTTHNREHTGHTNPHDHEIDWSQGFPHLLQPTNYLPELFPDGIPEFKTYMESFEMANYYENREQSQFKSISDFKWCMKCGGEVEFNWHGKSYGIVHDPGDTIVVYEADNEASEKSCKTSDEVLDILFDDVKLRNIITEIDVITRTV